MKILVINCGSSSIKYSLFGINGVREERLVEGIVEKIGESSSTFTWKTAKSSFKAGQTITNHKSGLKLILESLTRGPEAVLSSLSEIFAVGHRVVHGGDLFVESTYITEEVIDAIRECAVLAPLHNPPNLMGIEAARSLLPGVQQVAVFDTAFHQSMPEQAYIYAIPYELYEKHKIRRYGFHGASHKYVSRRAVQILGRKNERLRMITCHLGNGVSLAAIADGKSIDTSMGFTPLEGPAMGTRSGDIDPSIVFFLSEKEGLSLSEINDLLNRKSGLLGISGVSNDLREIMSQAEKGNHRAELALTIFANRIKKYVGAYAAILGGLDVLVFTGGIGENSPFMRERICEGLGFLGIHIDPEKNREQVGRERILSPPESRVQLLVVPTDEQLVIARETWELLHKT